ncbi:hypothetical protein O185_00670 [Photorhabdus temperata J3]|uniref:Uncharacterized protein n=1 Tax=Photorhabdus temperata J3 TaxID=1389415 RepID=U7R594_PHOTE|nr:hypothetical protein O185_00670 [Photorhabdus temperata J3]
MAVNYYPPISSGIFYISLCYSNSLENKFI